MRPYFPHIGLIDLSLMAGLTRFFYRGRKTRQGGRIIDHSPPRRYRRRSDDGGSSCEDVCDVRENSPHRIHHTPRQGQESCCSRRGRISSRRVDGGILFFESFDRPMHLQLQGPIKRLLVRIPPRSQGLEDIHFYGGIWVLLACQEEAAMPESSFLPFIFEDIW
jgi:hypothetical protein